MTQTIGITGGIGAGKSVVSRLLRCKGFTVYDCDSEARRIMDSSPHVRSGIAECLGPECLTPDGELNRPAIAARVFADEKSRLWLNSLVHGLVREDVLKRREELSANPDCNALFFVESAILHSSGLDEFCDRVWLVDADEETRISRAAGRDNSSDEQIRARIAAQQGELEGLNPDVTSIIRNDGSQSLLLQIDNLLNSIDNA